MAENKHLPATATERFIERRLGLSATEATKHTLIAAGVVVSSTLLGGLTGYAYAAGNYDLIKAALMTGTATAFGAYVAVSNTVWREEAKEKALFGSEVLGSVVRKQLFSMFVASGLLCGGFVCFAKATMAANKIFGGNMPQNTVHQVETK